VRTRLGLIAAAAACCCLLVPGSAAAQSLTPGPDLPVAESAGSARASSPSAGAAAFDRAKLQRKLRSLSARAPGSSGFYVAPVEGKGSALFGRKEGKSRKLASNTKLFTTAAALKRLGGGNGRLETTVYRRGNLERGVLRGSVYLVGDGDPSLGDSGMRELATEVSRTGINQVRGDLVADDTIFDRRRGVPDSGYGPSEYIAPLSGLVYGGSTYSGDPAKEAAKALERKLRKKGVRIKGKVRVGDTPKAVRADEPIAAFDSPPLSGLIEETNHNSNNFFAEMLLKRISAAGGKQGTTPDGARAVETFARTQGSKIDAKDGSGLTDGNKSSPRDVVRLLVSMQRGDERKAFYKSLPQAGMEGTLDGRMEGTPAAGSCRAKTGTINGVSTLSGYCKSGGQLTAFSLLMNGVSSYDAARAIQDDMVVAIAKYKP
jgi:D-alanyl-D-alanine carboxypeptidase/D-alanyl-D-alanine-endopeptidase (penicillin-binding protein 4)